MRKNISIFVIVLVVSFLVIIGKFFHIQIIQSDELQGKAIDQRVRKIKESPKRAALKDRNGNTIVYSLNMKDIEVYPDLIKTDTLRRKVARTLSEILDIDEEKVMRKLEEKDDNGDPVQWASIEKKVDPTVAAKIQESDVGSLIGITNNSSRQYVSGKKASNILGFVNDEGEPGAGLELTLDNYLSGIEGYRITELDSFGETIPIGLETIAKPVDGSEVYLTIDSFVQEILEDSVEDYYEEIGAKEIHAITMDPMNGEVLGMVSYPNFDPNDYQNYDKDTYNNHGASYVYEPGSTFKPIFLSIALDNGEVNPSQTFLDTGTIQRNGFSISNWNYEPLGPLTPEQIIVNSSNVGMAKISEKASREGIFEGLRKMGIGQPTGIELPNDEPGMMQSEESLKNDPLAQITQSYGHGIATTPLQIARAYSTLINGGYGVRPTLVKEIESPSGERVDLTKDQKKEKIISQETSEEISSYLEATWERHSDIVAPEGFEGGGKTGTTSKIEDGNYIDTTVGSFIGYLLIEEDGKKIPKYLTIVVVDEPEDHEERLGIYSAAPLFREIQDKIVDVKDLEPVVEEEKREIKEYRLSDYTLRDPEESKKEIEDNLGNEVIVKIEGEERIVGKQSYEYRNNRLEVTLHTTEVRGTEGFYIPDLTGKTPGEIYELFSDQGVDIEFLGKGKVFSQSVSPGIYKKEIKKIRLWLDNVE